MKKSISGAGPVIMLVAALVTGVQAQSAKDISWVLVDAVRYPTNKADFGFRANDPCEINDIALIANNVVVATTEVLFCSKNNGATWSTSSLPNPVLSGIAGSRNVVFGGNTLLAGVSNQLYLSTDMGSTWLLASNELPWDTERLISIGANLFAITDHGEIYLSDDSGMSWTKTLDAPSRDDKVSAIACTGKYVFAGTTRGVLRSADNGKSWIQVNSGISKSKVSFLTIVASSIFALNEDGIFRSSDNGTTWSPVNWNLPTSGGRYQAIAASGTNIFVGTYCGYSEMSLSSDNGITWTKLGRIPQGIIHTIACNGTRVFVGTNRGLFSATIENPSY